MTKCNFKSKGRNNMIQSLFFAILIIMFQYSPYTYMIDLHSQILTRFTKRFSLWYACMNKGTWYATLSTTKHKRRRLNQSNTRGCDTRAFTEVILTIIYALYM